ncbi:MAG: tellurite resistance protein TerC [Frankiaceae bacterium]|jgi:tellurite resistance protein TerC|nr:tellurite resistance protein TerC [Frankiaceae bacterium]
MRLLAADAVPDLHLDIHIYTWAAVVALIVVMIAADTFFFHRDAHEVRGREAAISSVAWVSIGLTFGLVLWWAYGGRAAGEYYAGFLLEKSLSVDNLFVFALILGYFNVPRALQHRVLLWGVMGALVFRAVFIALGVALLDSAQWMIYIFGAFLVYTAYRMLRNTGAETDPAKNPALRLLRRFAAVTPDFVGQRMTVRQNGKRLATPLLAVFVVIATTDVLFAVDSIPAVFAVTREPFIVFTSNAFALLGLRALYFLLADLLDKFAYLKVGLAAVLAFVGVKMLLSFAYHLPVWISLVVIVVVIGTSIGYSVRHAPDAEMADVEERLRTDTR